MDSFVNATDAFGKKLEELDISVNELFTKFGMELRKIYDITASKFDEINGTLVETILNVRQMTFVSETHVCYQLPFNSHSFNSVKEYIRIRVDSSRVPSVRFRCNEYFCEYTGPVDKITLDIPGRDIGEIAGGQLPFSLQVMQIVNTQLSIRTAIESLPELEGVEKCSTTITLEECKMHCHMKAVKEQCNCNPASTSALQPLEELRERACSWKQLKSCLPNFDTATPSLCIKACLPECSYLQYSKTEVPFRFNDGISQVFPSPTAEYILNVMSFEYPIYTEEYSWTFWSFIAGFEGNPDRVAGEHLQTRSIFFCWHSSWHVSIDLLSEQCRTPELTGFATYISEMSNFGK
uniref:Amiloride-sensitive sodium channel n=1 Tax=Plectus sambesii TaxID=2011161 RepID=A0A914XSB8_9BILA